MENLINTVIFDMDGVLLDSETICDRTWFKVAEEMNLPDIATSVNDCRGCNHSDTVTILQKKYQTCCNGQFDAEFFLQRTSVYFKEIETTEGIPLMMGATEILNYLKTKGYKLGLASSTKSSSVHRQLKTAGLFSFFDKIITGDMVQHSKPDPEIYKLAVNTLNADPSKTIAIEDSPNGIISAYNAGLKCVMVPDKIQPTSEIRSLLWKLCLNLNNLHDFL